VTVVAFFAQSATAIAGLRALKDNFDTKRITIVSAKPIEKPHALLFYKVK
jgi:hypothetical protein